jgi:hypothetical protein
VVDFVVVGSTTGMSPRRVFRHTWRDSSNRTFTSAWNPASCKGLTKNFFEVSMSFSFSKHLHEANIEQFVESKQKDERAMWPNDTFSEDVAVYAVKQISCRAAQQR